MPSYTFKTINFFYCIQFMSFWVMFTIIITARLPWPRRAKSTIPWSNFKTYRLFSQSNRMTIGLINYFKCISWSEACFWIIVTTKFPCVYISLRHIFRQFNFFFKNVHFFNFIIGRSNYSLFSTLFFTNSIRGKS